VVDGEKPEVDSRDKGKQKSILEGTICLINYDYILQTGDVAS